MFEGVLLDCLDMRLVIVPGLWEVCGSNSGRSRGDLGGYFVFYLDELYCALSNTAGESLRLSLARCVFGGGAAGSGVSDREVLFNVEAVGVGILDGIEDPALRCTNSSGAVAGDARGQTQLVGFAADDL
ncbi:hypothetical protein H7J74_09890 [Mycobacterium angelicum]|nr:hypothetical protein [Mycobacterium angelicum]MCV7196790.1 hypothetical protein [Mycobacterium angelicum]